jgi:hypothetical protein
MATSVADYPAVSGTGGSSDNGGDHGKPERTDIPVRKAIGGTLVGYSVAQCGPGVDKAPPAKAAVGFFKWGLMKLALMCKGKIASALASVAASQALVVTISIAVVLGIFVAGAMMVAS